jgi:hypothetical protein
MTTDRLCARPGYRHLSWFPEGDNAARIAREAIAICNRCPARVTCLAEAEARGETMGVYGGKRFTKPRKKAAPVVAPAPPPPVEVCAICALRFDTADARLEHIDTDHLTDLIGEPAYDPRPEAMYSQLVLTAVAA